MNVPLKRKILVLFLASFFLITACEKDIDEGEKAPLHQVSVLQVKPGLQQEFATTAQVFAHQISRITSEQRGTVESIFVKVGDVVTKDQKLISISSPYVSSAFQAAGSALSNARVSLEGTQLSAQKNIEAAEIALETAQTTLESTLRQNETLKKQAEETLNAAKLTVDLSVSAAQTTLDNAIKGSLPAVQAALTASDLILGVSEVYKYSNDLFEHNLGAFSKSTKPAAEQALENAQDQLAAYSESYENALALLLATENALQKTLTLLNNSVAGEVYPQTTLTTHITSITEQLTTIRSTISTLQSAKDALETAQQQNGGSKSQTVLNAEAAYEATISQLEANEESARKAVESAENALENAKRSANLSRLSAKSSLDTAYSAYDQARISKEKLVIKAPFDGKVVDIYVKTGEEINPGRLLIVVENDSELSIVAYLSPSDVQKVQVGDEATINYGFDSSITAISPSADPITKKYKVEIHYEKPVPEEGDGLRPSAPEEILDLKPGELVDLSFKTGEEFDQHRLFIPLPSLHIYPNEIFVWKVESGKTVKAQVQVGEIEGEYVEILNGLDIGDEIIVKGGRLIEEEGVRVESINQPSLELPENDKT